MKFKLCPINSDAETLMTSPKLRAFVWEAKIAANIIQAYGSFAVSWYCWCGPWKRSAGVGYGPVRRVVGSGPLWGHADRRVSVSGYPRLFCLNVSSRLPGLQLSCGTISQPGCFLI